MSVQHRAGRPLRFLALTLGGWAAARVVLLWPAGPPIAPMSAPRTMLASVNSARRLSSPSQRASMATQPAAEPAPARGTIPAPPPPAYGAPPRSPPSPAIVALAALISDGSGTAAEPRVQTDGAMPPPLRPAPIAAGRSRLAGSAWLIARGGAGAATGGALTGGQLGASQAGARLTYALGGSHRVALSARIATPLNGRGAEAAVGLDWQPTRLPLHLLAEQRVSLDGGRGGPALLLIGGIDPTPVGGGFRLEGYAQAGAIARAGSAGGVEAFGDGAARLTHRLATIGTTSLDLGAGAWGAGQRGVRRLDMGATIGAAVPISTRNLRLTLDWRQRVAGNARPGSGPALSIGTDF